MASYSRFLGTRVTVLYRVGEVLLPATGVFVGDSGRSIFLEQHIEQRGRLNYFRWEIPYPHIHRIEPLSEPAPPSADTPESVAPTAQDSNPAARAASASGGSAILPVAFRPKTS